MDQPNNVAAAIQAGVQLADAKDRVLDLEGIPLAIVPAGMQAHLLANVLDEADKRAEKPKRRKGTATHFEVDSFIEHVKRFMDADSAIFADPEKVKLTAVLDYHKAGAESAPRWGQHCAVYTCPLSQQWRVWIGANEKEMTQDQFADFIEANFKDLASPQAVAGGAISTDIAEPAAVIEMARNLAIRLNASFERKVNPTTGETTLIDKSEHAEGSTRIPRAFLLGIPVFEGGVLYSVEARVRLKLQNGRASFAYSLNQPAAIVRDAFAQVREKVKAETELPLFAGTPE